jgi:hypothetical protein
MMWNVTVLRLFSQNNENSINVCYCETVQHIGTKNITVIKYHGSYSDP